MPSRILYQILLLLLSALVASAEDIECSDHASLFGKIYDLSSLDVAMTAQRTRSTPPTEMIDTLEFNICKDLPPNDGPANDQCPSGSRACLTKTNKKEGENDRIVAVIPLATSSSLDPKFQALSEQSGFTILLHGGSYPAENGTPQIFNLTMLCGQEAKEPSFSDYNSLTGTGTVTWETPAACAKENKDDPPNPTPDEPSTPSGNGLGWFFFLFFLALGAYFVIGAYHNYTNYGATGWDLVPHRDFWRDVPFLLRDLAQHLITAVRGGPSRGGYHAV